MIFLLSFRMGWEKEQERRGGTLLKQISNLFLCSLSVNPPSDNIIPANPPCSLSLVGSHAKALRQISLPASQKLAKRQTLLGRLPVAVLRNTHVLRTNALTHILKYLPVLSLLDLTPPSLFAIHYKQAKAG